MTRRCPGCMELYSEEFEVCPHCGFIYGTQADEKVHMNPGTLLNGRYLIGRVLGYGGFGATYLGWDQKLEQKVAIKEYLPSEFATRMPGSAEVTIFTGDRAEQFQAGLEKFVEEARRLAKFKSIDGIVRIFDSFEKNNTAYIVMEYLEGETLEQYLDREGTVPEETAIRMLMPVMESLKVVHEAGMLHRDICPENIFLTKSGDIKLIDFGASRYATTTHSRSLTVMIKPGYSPEEQYRSRSDQGPHTDVYAIAATLYKMITGKTPPDAMERRANYENKNRDIFVEPHKLIKTITEAHEIAILNALNVRIEDRTPDIDSFLEELNADPPAKRRTGKIKKLDFYRWPIWLKISVPSALVCIAAVVVLLVTGVVLPSRFSENIVIPDGVVQAPVVEGLTSKEAVTEIEQRNLHAISAGTVQSDYIDAGIVVNQNPNGGMYINEYETIQLIVSSGTGVTPPLNGIATVPYVISDKKADALAKLKEAGLGDPELEEAYDNNIPEDSVIAQSLEYGTEVAEGTVITLTISLGPESFEMPDVTGMEIEEARTALGQLGLVVTVEYEESNQTENTVLRQSIAGGDEVRFGDTVTLTVATAQQAIVVSDVTGYSQENAYAVLTAQGFAVSVLENYSDTVAAGYVISQTPAGGTSQISGSTIVLYVSLGAQELPTQITEETTTPAPEETTTLAPEKTTTQPQTTTQTVIYQYREKQFTTADSPTLEGWTLYDQQTQTIYGEWIDMGWTTERPKESSTLLVTGSRGVLDATDYYYYHYYNESNENRSDDGDGEYPGYEKLTLDYELELTSYGYVYDAGMHGDIWYYAGSYNYYHDEWSYEQQEVTETTVYYFWKWGEWMTSESPVAENENREVVVR